MNLLNVDFDELYQRHLCRHGQFGINVWHIVAVYGIYFSICSLAARTVSVLWSGSSVWNQASVLLLLFAPYLALLSRCVPWPVFILTVFSAMLLTLAAIATPFLPFWLHLMLIPAWHRVQLFSHRRYTLHRDMSAFDSKYRKGRALFVLLAVYELPVLLQYLARGRRDWVR